MDQALRQEAYRQIQIVASELGHSPTVNEFKNHQAATLSPQRIIKEHGKNGWSIAKQKAGIDKIINRKLSQREMVELGLRLTKQLQHIPTWSEWAELSDKDKTLPSQWQIYRKFGGEKDSWRFFQYLIHEQLLQEKETE